MTDWDPWANRPPVNEIHVGDAVLRPGDRVRLHPLGRADIMDLALDGRTAVIDSIEEDLEDRVYLAVVVDDDPGKELGRLRQPGHRFFFGVEEVELLPGRAGTDSQETP